MGSSRVEIGSQGGREKTVALEMSDSRRPIDERKGAGDLGSGGGLSGGGSWVAGEETQQGGVRNRASDRGEGGQEAASLRGVDSFAEIVECLSVPRDSEARVGQGLSAGRSRV